MAHEFVSEFPLDECKVVASAILSKNLTINLLRPAWVVAEFAFTQVVPGGMATVMGTPDEQHVDETGALTILLKACDDTSGMQALPIPWFAIAVAVLKAILALLTGVPVA